MNLHSTKRARQLGLSATAMTALGLVAVLPAQAAVADGAHSAAAFVRDGTLNVVGTPDGDEIALGLSADPALLRVELGAGRSSSFDRSTFSSIRVSLGSGNDAFSADRGDFHEDALTVDGGAGNDTIVGGAGDDLLIGGTGNDAILGGAGTDTVFGGNGVDTVDGGRGTDTEILGNGDDVAVWDPGEGSDDVVGGHGHDVLVFHGANIDEHIALAAEGSHAVLTRSPGSVRMDTVGVEQFQVAALGGADSISVGDLRGTDLRQNDLDLSAAGTGDLQSDTVQVAGTAAADHVSVDAPGEAVDVTGLAVTTTLTGTEGFDLLQISTGDGNDTVHVSDAVHKRIGVAVDLGAGQL
jgi:hypothetical protein